MARSGAFTGTLDPFGGSRGGLGRYNVTGDTISSLAQYEAYAVEVAWSNGDATDEQYLAALQKLVDLSNPGTRERVTAENRLHDAVYTIGRNKLVRAVNDSTDFPSRRTALENLLTYEEGALKDMTATDSQAYRAQLDKISSVRGDLRQSAYSDMVARANKGQVSTKQLIAAAQGFLQAALSTGDPDIDTWRQTIDGLNQRAQQERVAQLQQDFQHNRIDGSALVAELTNEMAGMDPASASYQELARSREDIVDRVNAVSRDKAEANIQSLRADGRLSDDAFLSYLRDAYAQAEPGTAEQIRAGSRLREFTFSLAEDKLRFDVSEGRRPVSDLIRFYRGYLATMDPNSEKYRTVQGAIDSLLRGGSGGGGGGSSDKNGSYLAGPGLINGTAALADLVGNKVAPPGFADLFRIDPTNTAAWHWWTNNRDSALRAFTTGADTWTYYDQRGNATKLPFDPSMMSEFDATNIALIRVGLGAAENMKDAQTWVDRLIAGSSQQQSHGETYTRDVFDKVWRDLSTKKDQALASGDLVGYYNFTLDQTRFAENILGKSLYLTPDDRDKINTKLAGIAPQDNDPSSLTYNPKGDPILNLFRDGATPGASTIRSTVDPETGKITSAQLDPRRGFLTQDDSGRITISTVDLADPTQTRLKPADPNIPGSVDETVPAYYDTHARVTVSGPMGTVDVWQPIIRPGDVRTGQKAGGTPVGARVFTLNAGRAPVSAGKAGYIAGGQPYPVGLTINGTAATLPLFYTYTWERSNGRLTKVLWATTTDPASNRGGDWVRWPTTGPTPQLVVPTNVTIGQDGSWQIDGKAAAPEDVLRVAHIWTSEDAGRAGSDYGLPGVSLDVRHTNKDGSFDARPGWQIDAERAALDRVEHRIAVDSRVRTAFTAMNAPEDTRAPGPQIGQTFTPRTAADRRGELLPMEAQAARVAAAGRGPRAFDTMLPNGPGFLAAYLYQPKPTVPIPVATSHPGRDDWYRPPQTPELAAVTPTKLLPLAPTSQLLPTALKPITTPQLAPVPTPVTNNAPGKDEWVGSSPAPGAPSAVNPPTKQKPGATVY